MKNTTKNWIAFFSLCCISIAIHAQEKVEKLNENFQVADDITVNVNTLHTDLVFETWNRNTVAVQAFVSSEDLSEDELNEIAKNWQINALGNSHKITISTSNQPSVNNHGVMNVPQLMGSIQNNMIAPLMNTMVGPMLQKMGNTPLPPQFYKNLSSLKFDYDAYKRDGEKYMKAYEKEIQKKFGKNFQKAMENWGKDFQKNAENWSKELDKKMDDYSTSQEDHYAKLGEDFGQQMEAWGQQFGKNMEAWAQQFAHNQQQYVQHVSTVPGHSNSSSVHIYTTTPTANTAVKNYNFSGEKIKRTVVIKVPKNAKLILNSRYGNLNFKDDLHNVHATIAHANFKATRITGKETVMKIDYTPIAIDYWEYGKLSMRYVKKCSIKKVKSIKIASNASDVDLGELEDTGIISGSFGKLSVEKLGNDFKRLNINLENSDLTLYLPKSAFNFNYSGAQSAITYPENLTTNVMDNYGSKLINGYYKSRDTDSSININAKFSEVTMQ